MENLKICIKEMVDAYKDLEDAKEDCKIRVDGAFATLKNDEESEKLNLNKKVLTKFAKSIASEKVGELSDECVKTATLLEEVLGISQAE